MAKKNSSIYQKDLFSALNTADNVAERVSKYGVESCNNIDLIETIIAPYIDNTVDSGELAVSLQGALNGESTVSVDMLMKIKGVTAQMATSLVVAVELGRRLGSLRARKTVTGPTDIFKAVIPYWNEYQENFVVVGLNGAYEILYTQIVTTGLLNRTVVHPREVFARAIKDRCCSIAIAHNHPSGNVEPSEDDRQVTIRLQKAGEILGIKVLDHIVFSDERYFSFLEHGWM